MIEDLDSFVSEALAGLFNTMDWYYTEGEGSLHKEAGNLWLLFDYLAEIFG